MAENFVIKTKNGEDWDILHPETNMGQVIGLQDRLETLEELPVALTAVGGRVDALETDVATIKEDIEALETGPMAIEVYDPNGISADIFEYADTAKADAIAAAALDATTKSNAAQAAAIAAAALDATTKADAAEAAAKAASIPLVQKGSNSGVAELDESGKVPAGQLPSYVDDVLEFPSLSDFPAIGESGKIYITIDENLTYRWSGTTYVLISASLALGETVSTAYRGDRGKIAYDHTLDTDNPHETTAEQAGAARTDLTNVENTTFLAKAVEAGVSGSEGASYVYVSMVEPETSVGKTVWFQTTTI